MLQIHAAGVNTAVVFMTVHDEPAMVREAIRAGARGYLLKAAAGEELLRALHEVASGRVYVSSELWSTVAGQTVVPALTGKQKKVLDLLSTGLRSREIAARLGISARTVDSHRYSVMKAFGVRTSIALIREAERLGVVSSK